MTAARLKPEDPTLLDCFRTRCEACAALVAAAEMNLIDAVDEMQTVAQVYDLTNLLGQDAVQSILSDAFKVVRR